jgi:glycerate kinase
MALRILIAPSGFKESLEADEVANCIETGILKLERIELRDRDPRLEKVQIDVACNWHNLLCGSKGVARVFGPQKGASPEMVEQLAAALDRYAAVIERDLGIDAREMPGSGASGDWGLAYTHSWALGCIRATIS